MNELVSPAFYESLGDGRFRSTERTEGPWSPELQHAGPPCALLARAIEACGPRDDAIVSRIAIEILGPVPVAEVEVRAEVDRPGRSVELLKAELSTGGRVAMRASAWRIAKASVTAGPVEEPAPPLPPDEGPPPPAIAHAGYLRSVEWRNVAGDWTSPGPATVWARPRVPLVPDEAMSGLQRLLCVADSCSGISAALPWDRWLFINTDLTVHVAREPRGEWILLDCVTRINEGGVGLASAAVGDEGGILGRSAQTLLVRENA
ncbi:MAG: thioesterase family protein [Solirubrobacteraceae bacterium]|nr:thioesterase family protein [Solirubrobacteraceae bacterium]